MNLKFDEFQKTNLSYKELDNIRVKSFKKSKESNSFKPLNLRMVLSEVLRKLFVLTPGISVGY